MPLVGLPASRPSLVESAFPTAAPDMVRYPAHRTSPPCIFCISLARTRVPGHVVNPRPHALPQLAYALVDDKGACFQDPSVTLTIPSSAVWNRLPSNTRTAIHAKFSSNTRLGSTHRPASSLWKRRYGEPRRGGPRANKHSKPQARCVVMICRCCQSRSCRTGFLDASEILVAPGVH